MENNIQALTNTQLEILKVFRHNLDEKDLKNFKKVLTHFFAKILMDEADHVWEEEKWNDKKVDELLNTKLRKRD